VPWFVPFFWVLAALRSAGAVPDGVAADGLALTRVLSVVAMAGLGLCVDVRHLWRLSGRLSLAVTTSLLALIAIGFAAIRLLGVT
ncbi:putative sulfate exporter family transporter, partial [Azospirillum sp. A39]|uniref:putative sulfate exporter family transporter n=1 Tax=Azospirillum sp. A39 TaxID=3462279 RepID=UPI0040453E3B